MQESDVTRITPAYAGKSRRRLFRGERCEDHPRLCGEKIVARYCSNRYLGSPPPMRGKAVQCGAFASCSGITPAYAGKSSFTNFSNFIFQDHPRLCGEKNITSFRSYNGLGSPPPMRGKATRREHGTPAKRITPAYAGKRHLLHVFVLAHEDHPRLCGEKTFI